MSIVGATSTEGLSSLQRFTNIFTAILTSFRHKRAALANSSPLGREDQHQILAFGFLRAIVLKVLKQKVSSRRCRSRSGRKQQRRRRDCTSRTGAAVGCSGRGSNQAVRAANSLFLRRSGIRNFTGVVGGGESLGHLECVLSVRVRRFREGEGRPGMVKGVPGSSLVWYISGLSMRLWNLFANRGRCYFCFSGRSSVHLHP